MDERCRRVPPYPTRPSDPRSLPYGDAPIQPVAVAVDTGRGDSRSAAVADVVSDHARPVGARHLTRTVTISLPFGGSPTAAWLQDALHGTRVAWISPMNPSQAGWSQTWKWIASSRR